MSHVVRHEGHDGDHDKSHYANIIYGYEFFLLCGIAVVLLSIRNSIASAFIKRFQFALTIPTWLSLALWLFFVSAFCIAGTPHTFSGVAKRIGRITYSILPLSLFLSLQPSPLPKTYYIKLIFFHKWVSRTIVLTGTVHGILYITHFIRVHETHKIFKFDNFLGICLLTCLYVIAISSLLPFRQRQYKYFYMIHYPLAWVVLIGGIFHARPGVSLLAFWSIFMLIAQAVYKMFTARTTNLDVNDVSSTLQIVSFRRELLPDYFEPGSHIRLSLPIWNPMSWILPSHPYTIASIASDDDLKLVVRKTRFRLTSNCQYSLTGPYSPSNWSDISTSAKKVILFAGGSGISFAAPVLKALTLNGIQLKLIWITKDVSNLLILETLGITDASVFLTGQGLDGSSEDPYGDTVAATNISSKYDTNAANEEVELHELLDRHSASFETDRGSDEQDTKVVSNGNGNHSTRNIGNINNIAENETITSDTNDGMDVLRRRRSEIEESFYFERSHATKKAENFIITYGRPDFNNVSQDFISEEDKESSKVWAVACGPRSLVKDVQKWALCSGIRYTGEKYFL